MNCVLETVAILLAPFKSIAEGFLGTLAKVILSEQLLKGRMFAKYIAYAL